MSPRPQAADRLRRVLAIVPYIAARGVVSIAELSEAFGVPEAEIEADLDILPFCGLPPYTPDRLIDVSLDGEFVSIRFAEYWSRPLRLTPAEGFALLAAGRALLAVPGSDPEGPLANALAKLEAALGAQEVLEVDIGEPDHVDELRRAAERREQVEIEYWSFGRDAMTTRTVDPYGVHNLRGHWYLAAFCHQAGDDRLFRVDRVRAVRLTGDHFAPPTGSEAPHDVFDPEGETTLVTLDLPADARWVVEAYPTESVTERKDGRMEVRLPVAARAWLERLILAVGAEARVVDPADWVDVGSEAASRVLARYR